MEDPLVDLAPDPELLEGVDDGLVLPEHEGAERADTLGRGRARETLEEERAEPPVLVGVTHDHGDLGHIGLARGADAPGHAEGRLAGRRGVDGDPGDVVDLVELGQVAEESVAQGRDRPEEPVIARAAREAEESLGEPTLVVRADGTDADESPFAEPLVADGRLRSVVAGAQLEAFAFFLLARAGWAARRRSHSKQILTPKPVAPLPV